jgi:carboxylesterase type B
MNYLLGMLGWLAGPTFLAEGGTPNAGLLDQRLALQWIHDYTGLFGVDPDNVTG